MFNVPTEESLPVQKLNSKMCFSAIFEELAEQHFTYLNLPGADMEWKTGLNNYIALNAAQYSGGLGCGLCVMYRYEGITTRLFIARKTCLLPSPKGLGDDRPFATLHARIPPTLI